MDADLCNHRDGILSVWDRLWRYEPSEGRDDALLDRERRSPRWALIQRKLATAFGSIEGVKTIELGSGRGDLSVLLAESGADVTLLDASDKALSQADRRFARLGLPAHFEQGDFLGKSPIAPSGYDVAISSGVIEHFAGNDRTAAIFAHHRVLKPGGVGIISVPNARCPTYRVWKAYLELRGWWPYGFERPYTARELRRRAIHAGFTMVEVHGKGFWQSVGDHGCRPFLGRRLDWAHRTSVLDPWFGLSLILFGQKGATVQSVANDRAV